MDEVSKLAHSVQARLERLQQDNKTALERKVLSALPPCGTNRLVNTAAGVFGTQLPRSILMTAHC